MDIRQLTPDYAVSPQIDPQDLPAIAALGFTTIINNRPCSEIPPSHQVDAMQAAATAAGIELVVLPVTHATLSVDLAAQQQDACSQAKGPVLAYCASGTRSTIVWALSQAGKRDTDEIMQTAAQNGYDLSMMRGQLNALAGS
ncbi:TIGR01244 family protein [Octadecabacter temperatus]|uniref:Beta-lactamase hydrolase-like protein n=1 Tax=Octadecabacter temperatus TaxID=1458307 RepID=A0A0K0Y455_9RHOB|nr:TIGR01244 family sulfur transferase [Octadecabacter temperatus]AKS45748.1 Beta-lactamase hydrolase-like protein [Octadecabacter temperatus]SIN99644.1 TIGR01244 family protein [Octadecabacter temperatus]